jgi:hypothetical protein
VWARERLQPGLRRAFQLTEPFASRCGHDAMELDDVVRRLHIVQVH